MDGVIRTIKQNCRRCYSCVRECPAKAIRIVDGQASVVAERCVACGNCTAVCSQNAKAYESGLEAVTALLAGPRPVVALVAPSFPADGFGVAPDQLVGALRAAGFAQVVEVAHGAELVSDRYLTWLAAHREGLRIVTSCPAIVEYVRKYTPALVPYVAPIVTPMIATALSVRARLAMQSHGREQREPRAARAAVLSEQMGAGGVDGGRAAAGLIPGSAERCLPGDTAASAHQKTPPLAEAALAVPGTAPGPARLGRRDASATAPHEDVACVFIGPCVAKKLEARDPLLPPVVDAVLTFSELHALLFQRGVSPTRVAPAEFDPPHAGGGRVYPMVGGMLCTAGLERSPLNPEMLVLSGAEEAIEGLSTLDPADPAPLLVEAMMCRGCFMGPGMGGELKRRERKRRVSEYVQRSRQVAAALAAAGAGAGAASPDAIGPTLPLERTFAVDDQRLQEPTEEDLRFILARTNKFTRADELNCGACGYGTCRAKAAAVFRGLAEEAMCLPFMIEQAERVCHELKVPWTELREVHRHLINAEKLASMGQMAAGVAHELNNPLGTILLYTSLLQRKLCGPDAQERRKIYAAVQVQEPCRQGAGATAPPGAAASGARKPLPQQWFRRFAPPSPPPAPVCSENTAARAARGSSKFATLRSSRRDDLAEDLQLLVDEANRCKRISGSLLDFARQNRVNLAPTKMAELLRRVVEETQFAVRALDPPVALEWSAPDDLVVDLDRDQLAQVLVNLAKNGLEAMEGRSGVVRLAAAPAPDPDHVRLTVEDQGRGIPAEARDRIFQPFFTTKSIGKGTGLGLAISYGIVKMHRGTIWFDSRFDESGEGRGTTFVIELPRRQALGRSLFA
jgi:signal transduction histidine kinase/NAD-dependent dihydropyrimidine dehydrogenase PreA subunit